MKRKLLTALGVISLAVAGPALAAGNAAHDHGHAAAETTTLLLNAGKKWETDAADQIAGKSKQAKRMNGAVKVIGALEKYSMYFDDPGFKPIRH